MKKPRRILSVFGTRPEAIKMAPVVKELEKHPREFTSRVVVTAQHRHLLDQVLQLFDISPDHDLGLMRPRQTLGELSARILTRLTPVLLREKPDAVLVHGDTTTALMTALAAFYLKIPVGHVEAGLRSYDDQNPYPEEANRRLVDSLSHWHFAPTPSARKNLLKENISPQRLVVTGNTVIDALQLGLMRCKAGALPSLRRSWAPLLEKPFVLVTAHRRENWGTPLRDLALALRDFARRNSAAIVYPVHPNPHVLEPIHSILGKEPNVHLLPPLDYGEFLPFLKKAQFVVTDSGGLQEEAPSLGKPVLVVRKTTERPEAVAAGTVRLVGVSRDSIYRWMIRLAMDKTLYQKMAQATNPYGDGRAARRIVHELRRSFGSR